MSNSVVGSVYQQIIEDVISTSRVDFEENGVEESVLEDLRQGWQKKLSQFNVAQFPWDPKPEPEAAANGTPAASSATAVGSSAAVPSPAPPSSADNSFSQPTMSPVPGSQGLSLPSLPMPSFEPASGIKSEDGHDGIKLEPDTQNGSGLAGVPNASNTPVPPPPFPSHPGGGGNAAARAVQQLQNTFGQRAAASINAIHSGMNQQGGGGNQGGGQQQPQQRGGALSEQQYRAQVAARTAAQLNGSANGVAKSQVDGSSADDDDNMDDDSSGFEGVLLQRQQAGRPPVELGRVEIDNLLHEQVAARAKQMEGGGLMLPLREATSKGKGKGKRTAGDSRRNRGDRGDGGAIAQMDGVDDDDEDEDDVKQGILDDEDAINSDLDDSEDDKEDEDDEDDVMGPIMLCVYDKVQRVKNKWKCTLKDGVLTVGGKEYVFHKATGEYEW